MRRLAALALVVAASLAPGLVPAARAAGDFDGSKLLICAPVEALDCQGGEGCGKGLPDDLGLPAFMRIDFAKKAVIGPRRSSPIQAIERSDAQLLLQGTELGYAWAIALDQERGRMTVTLASRDDAVVLFGSCIAP